MSSPVTHGHLAWYELMSVDPKGSLAFYSDLFGWTSQAFGDEGYVMFVSPQGPLGGVTETTAQAKAMGATSFWMAHIEVADVDAAVAKVTAAGGSVVHRENVPTVGDFAVIRDPQSAVISVFKPVTSMRPHDPGQPSEMCWAELYTTDAPKALAFFSDLVGWEPIQEQPIPPMGTYYIFGSGGVGKGGMMNLPPGTKTPDGRDVPPSWMFYVRVADLDAALARATTLGSTVINGPMTVPGGQRVVQMIDPFGAAFAMSSMPVSPNG